MQHGLCVCVHVSLLASECDQISVCTCRGLRATLCMCVRCHSQVSLLSSAFKLMIWGPENQQIWPLAGHNGELDLLVDVFEDCSSFFSVNTSLPPHNRHIYNTNSHVTPVFMLLTRKFVLLCGYECVYAYWLMIILHVSMLWQSVKIMCFV